jgi:FtsP/CotA-like multicopper oxidase with cupredoxin domain
MDWKKPTWRLGLVGVFAVSSAIPALSYASLGLTPSGRTPGQTITDMLGSTATSELNTTAPEMLGSAPELPAMDDMGGEPMLMEAGWSSGGYGGYGGGGTSTPCSSSPTTTAFQAALPIPPTLTPSSTDATTDYYTITMTGGSVQILPAPNPKTPIWGFNGITPGPVIKAQKGRQVKVHMTNSLSENMSTHLHGGHTPSDNNYTLGSDGGPMAVFGPGTSRDYTYPNNQIAATLWYHDHAMDLTAAHVYEGLAAPYILTDSVEQGLGLPSGSYDIPLVIQDKTFNADGSLCYQVDSSTIRQGFQGDTLLVNGAVQPYFKVAQHKYRLRFLNGSNSSRYELALSNGDSLTQIASDGGLLQAPVTRTSALIAPAEREEFVIDFSKYPVGTQIILNNKQSWGTTNTSQIMRFDVTSTATDTSKLPTTLATIKKIDPNTASVSRTWTLDSNNGTWSLNGQPFDPNRIDAQVKLGSTEVWTFQNHSGEYHPIHVHDMEFQIVSEDGGAVPAYDAGWKDVFLVKPWSSVKVVTTFTDNLGTYVIHCHNLEHEDHAMMAQFQVVP